MTIRLRNAAWTAGTLLLFGSSAASAQTDPGVRPGLINGQAAATATVPLALPSVLANNPQGVQEFFQNALDRFANDVETVNTPPNVGLGPRFNMNVCGVCHQQPTIGGTSPAVNPEFAAVGTIAAASANTVPYFVTQNGPMREAHFPFFLNADGSPNLNAPNGAVEDLYTVTGLPGAESCTLQQPAFNHMRKVNNISFRIPPTLFGDGLIENLDDSTLLKNQAAQASNHLGISGTFNRNAFDATINRYGWKAQVKAIEDFAALAYTEEEGITNEIFPNERPLPGEDMAGGLPAGCLNLAGVGYPEDTTNFAAATPGSDQFAQNAQIPSDIVQFSMFIRLVAPPTPSTDTPGGAASITHGSQVFQSVGCAVCHTPALGPTQPSNFTPSLGGATVNAFTDLEVHHMGRGLADNIAQGAAGGDQFKTAPLWGIGQRIFFLHDGRTNNLLTAIQDHASNGSEATQVVRNFDQLPTQSKQDLLNFLRSL